MNSLRKRKTIFFVGIIPVLFMAGISLSMATLRPSPGSVDIASLIAKSTIICRGKVLDTNISSPEARSDLKPEHTVFFQPDRFYKGQIMADKVYFSTMERTLNLHSGRNLKKGEYHILFLKTQGNSTDQAYFLNSNFKTSSRKGRFSKKNASFKELIGIDLKKALDQNDPDILSDTFSLLRALKIAVISDRVKQLATGELKNIRGYALALIVQSGDRSIMNLVLDHVTASPVNSIGDKYLENSIRQINDESFLDDLHGIALSGHDSYRRASLQSLRKLKSKRSVSVMMILLDDKNIEIRYSSLMVLNKIVPKSSKYGPSWKTFNSSEEAVRLWKEWWKNRPDSQKQHYGTRQSS